MGQLTQDNTVKQDALEAALAGDAAEAADAAGGGKAGSYQWGEKGVHAKQSYGKWLTQAAVMTAMYEAGHWRFLDENIAEYKWASWAFCDAVKREARRLT